MPEKRAEDDDAVSQSSGTLSAERKNMNELVSLSPGTRGHNHRNRGGIESGFSQRGRVPWAGDAAAIMRRVHSLGGDGTEHFCQLFDEGMDTQLDSKRGKIVAFN
ncbi:hypothetical protein niasHT_029890 [Heterodera trifolii]|uniref:Uncharacterized protein n=1 Tax=Heterodera trifolii TaxID=157864 RepID=A0ABD2KB53_9BILA